MIRFSERSGRSIVTLCIQIAWCLPWTCSGQAPPRAAYFVVSGTYGSSYQSQGNSTEAYSGTYSEADWNVSQDGLRIVGSLGPNSAIVSYHADQTWFDGPLAKEGGEQWSRLASESIDVYVAGAPGTPFTVNYSYVVSVAASDLSSPCSDGYTSAYFRGPQTAHVIATEVGQTPSQSLRTSQTITGVTQNRTIADPSGGTEVYSYAWTLSNSRGVTSGDIGNNRCSPPKFTGAGAVDATITLGVNGPAPPLPTPPLKSEFTALQPLLNDWCTSSLLLSSPSGMQQIPTRLGAPACWLSEALKRISDDPPDPQFTVLRQPDVPYLPKLAASGTIGPGEATSINALNSNQLQAVAYAEAILTSLERSEGASIGGNSYWKQKQDELTSQFVAQLGAILGAEPSLLADTKNALVLAGLGPLLITAGDVAEFQANLATNGLPASLVPIVTGAGATPEDLVKLQSLVLFEATVSFPKIFPDLLTDSSLITSLGTTAAALRNHEVCAADMSGSFAVTRSQVKPGSSATSFIQTLTLTNTTANTISGPVSLVLDRLNSSATVLHNSGSTLCTAAPSRAVFVNANLQANTLAPGESTTIDLQFTAPSADAIAYCTRVLGGQGIR